MGFQMFALEFNLVGLAFLYNSSRIMTINLGRQGKQRKLEPRLGARRLNQSGCLHEFRRVMPSVPKSNQTRRFYVRRNEA